MASFYPPGPVSDREKAAPGSSTPKPINLNGEGCPDSRDLYRVAASVRTEFPASGPSVRSELRRYIELAGLVAFVLVLFALLMAPVAFGQTSTQTAQASSASSEGNGIGLLGAGLAIAGSCVGAGYAVGKAASAAAAAIVEKPATFGPLLILAGLGEGIAIYGLLVAFEILTKIP